MMREAIEKIIDSYYDGEHDCISNHRTVGVEGVGKELRCVYDEVRDCLMNNQISWHLDHEYGEYTSEYDIHFYAFAWVDCNGLDMICITAKDYK